MNIENISNNVVNELIERYSNMKTICIYSGRFQPFHISHYNVYKKLCLLFGR